MRDLAENLLTIAITIALIAATMSLFSGELTTLITNSFASLPR
jgi:hypothetical protein